MEKSILKILKYTGISLVWLGIFKICRNYNSFEYTVMFGMAIIIIHIGIFNEKKDK